MHQKSVNLIINGFIKNKSLYDFTDEAPQKPESFLDIMQDVDDKIMPGMVHWNHPQFFAYFPSGNSFPSILAEMLSSATGAIGFSWVRFKKLLYKKAKMPPFNQQDNCLFANFCVNKTLAQSN